MDVQDVRLGYVDWRPVGPSHGPVLVLLHGMSSNALFWTRVAGQLQNRHVVALDLRGHGHSDRPSSGYTAARMAADIASAIQALHLGAVVVVGHSWGAAVGLVLSSQWPDLASALVLVDGPTAHLSQRMTFAEADEQMRPPAPCYQDLLEAERGQARFLGGAWGADLRGFVHRSFQRSADCWHPILPEPGRQEMVRDLYSLQPEELLSALRMPVLMIAASDDTDGVAPLVLGWWRARAEAAAALCRAGESKRYDSGHDIPLIRPEALAVDLARVADRVVAEGTTGA